MVEFDDGCSGRKCDKGGERRRKDEKRKITIKKEG